MSHDNFKLRVKVYEWATEPDEFPSDSDAIIFRYGEASVVRLSENLSAEEFRALSTRIIQTIAAREHYEVDCATRTFKVWFILPKQMNTWLFGE